VRTRDEERLDSAGVLRTVDAEPGSPFPNMGPSSGHELAACCRRPAHDFRHLAVRKAEDLAEHEGRALGRTERFQQDEHRHAHRLVEGHAVLRAKRQGCRTHADDRLGQPRADITLALNPGGLQHIEADPRDRRSQPRLGIDHITHIPSRETQVRLLNGVFRVRDGPEHPVRDAGEVGAVPLEFRLAGRHLVLRPGV